MTKQRNPAIAVVIGCVVYYLLIGVLALAFFALLKALGYDMPLNSVLCGAFLIVSAAWWIRVFVTARRRIRL